MNLFKNKFPSSPAVALHQELLKEKTNNELETSLIYWLMRPTLFFVVFYPQCPAVETASRVWFT